MSCGFCKGGRGHLETESDGFYAGAFRNTDKEKIEKLLARIDELELEVRFLQDQLDVVKYELRETEAQLREEGY